MVSLIPSYIEPIYLLIYIIVGAAFNTILVFSLQFRIALIFSCIVCGKESTL